MTDEMKYHIDELAKLLVEEGLDKKIIIDSLGGALLTIDKQIVTYEATKGSLNKIFEDYRKKLL